MLFCFLQIIFAINYSSAQNNSQKIISKSSTKEGNITNSSTRIKKEDPKKDTTIANQRNKNYQNQTVPAIKRNEFSQKEIIKPHFDLRLNNNLKNMQSSYINALNNYPRIENYRFVNKRRIIQLANGAGEVELYSANELWQLYGRRVRPQNIKDGQALTEIELMMGENGLIKEQLKKQ